MNADRYALMWANGMKFRDVLDAYAHDLTEEIRADMERQGAGGQYDMGMKRACFLIDPEASSE